VQVTQQPVGGEQRGVLRQVLAVHDQVLPVHVDLHVADPLRLELVDHIQAHADVAHQDLHRGLGVLVLEEQRHAVTRAYLRGLPHAVDQPPPRVHVRGLERIVVALASRPDDQVGTERAGEVGGIADDPASFGTDRGVGVDKPSATEARVEV